MVFYTGKGDKGTTRVLDSKSRFPKHSVLAEALGTVDELNSFIGYARACSAQGGDERVKRGTKTISVSAILLEVQETLFIVQAQLAGADKRLSKSKITNIEKVVDTIERELPPLTSFTIAGATEYAALLDILRTISRRAERRVVAVAGSGERKVSDNTLAYLNRLSSLFFALARLAAHRAGSGEAHPDYK